MKNILFVVDERQMGGVSVLLEDILKKINLQKYKIDIMVLHNNGDYLTNLPKNVNIIYGTSFFEVVDLSIKEVLKTKNIIKILKKENYELAINLQPSIKTRLLVRLSGIKKEYVYKKNYKMHAVTNFYRTGLKAFPNMIQEKELKLYLPEEYIKKEKDLLKYFKKPLIIINAGGMFSKRQGRAYPINKWIELGNKLQDKFNGTIILNGAKEDKEFLKPLNKIKNSINFIGELTLEDSCGIISQADYLISGDSGPLHIATALKIKSIGLYGAMPASRTGCFCSGINIISNKNCAPCNKRRCKYLAHSSNIYAPCMEEISPDTIINEINSKYQV